MHDPKRSPNPAVRICGTLICSAAPPRLEGSASALHRKQCRNSIRVQTRSGGCIGAQNIVLLVINLIGVYRYLFRSEKKKRPDQLVLDR